jgi:septal ring factor EnvC (AmiA/AmiB activator)
MFNLYGIILNDYYRRLLVNAWLPCCLFLALPAFAATTTSDKNTELESVRGQIEDVKSGLNAARGESGQLQDELRRIEIAAGQETVKLREVEQLIRSKQARLTDLNNVIAMHTQSLDNERQHLGRQIRTAYMTGRNDYLKLLLNQEDPARVGRMLAYYDYYNRTRVNTINSVTSQVETIKQLQSSILSETALLEQLKSRQIEKSRELAAWRESRQSILQRLENDITAKDQELKSLEEHEQKLSALLRKLDKHKNTVTYFEDSTPFKTLLGKLQWPVAGRLLNAFGDERRGASLKWDGVKIGADAGNEVRAVHAGRVVFADWFRNLGLLIILDHGEGYMSLYGYNQSLLKKPGDWVLAGEPIAYVGDSGGQNVPAVYFEIRHDGTPVDPALWCAR